MQKPKFMTSTLPILNVGFSTHKHEDAVLQYLDKKSRGGAFLGLFLSSTNYILKSMHYLVYIIVWYSFSLKEDFLGANIKLGYEYFEV